MITVSVISLLIAIVIAWAFMGARWDPEFERAYLFDGLTDQ